MSVGLNSLIPHAVVLSLCFSAVGGHRSLGSILCPVCTSVSDSSKGEPEPIGSSRIFELSIFELSKLPYQWLWKSELNQFVTTAKKKGNLNKQCFQPSAEHLWEISAGQTWCHSVSYTCRWPLNITLSDRVNLSWGRGRAENANKYSVLFDAKVNTAWELLIFLFLPSQPKDMLSNIFFLKSSIAVWSIPWGYKSRTGKVVLWTSELSFQLTES